MSSDDGESLVEVNFRDRRAMEVAGPLVSNVAGMLGIDPQGQAQLQSLTGELVRAVLQDSFREDEPIDVTLRAAVVPGELQLELDYHGAPTSFRLGRLPERVDTLVALGFADALEVGSAGIAGNRALIRKALPLVSLTDDAEFTAATDSDAPPADADSEELTVRVMTAADVVAVARLYFRTYGYTKILTPYVYDPDLFAELLETHRHLAVVSVTAAGRVVGHIGLTRDSDDKALGCADTLAVEPAYRKRGIVGTMTPLLVRHLLAHAVTGLYGEAVTMHTASQRVALDNGGTETGVLLGRQPPDVQLTGFDAVNARRALVLVYQRLAPLAPLQVYPPAVYAQIVGEIYAHAGFDRTVVAQTARPAVAEHPETVLDIEFWARLKTARLVLVRYGEDFLPVLQELFHRLDRDGYEVAQIELPLADPATATFAAGLSELGVSFHGVMPDDDGDMLLLARCGGDIDLDSIQVASDFGAQLRDFVVGDYRRVAQALDARARSRAAMARIYDAL